MVAIAAAVVAVTVASNWFACTLSLPTDAFGHEVDVGLETGALTVWWVPAPSLRPRGWVRFDAPFGFDWIWSFQVIDDLPSVWVFRVSGWLLSLPPAGLALLGFAFLRRTRDRAIP